jgi:hypothetical protein
MTLPRHFELAGLELARRLTQFRNEIKKAGATPPREVLARLLDRAVELGLPETEIGEELAELRAGLDALDLQERLARGEIPLSTAPEPMSAGDLCYFVCPVRFGRRRADQFGRLSLSLGRLKFIGALEVSVAWSEIASVQRDGRQILVTLQDSTRLLRFCCVTYAEAARGLVVAEYLSHAAKQSLAGFGSPHYVST